MQNRPSLPPDLERELDFQREALQRMREAPELVSPWMQPCRLRVLVVADGGLDFSAANFGLSTFVRTLLDPVGTHLQFRVTLGLIDPVGAKGMLDADPRIERRIPQFRFDDPSHFGPDLYDVAMLFCFAFMYDYREPATRLAESELRALVAFMNGGGGVFATGDHGVIGSATGGMIPRVRGMRRWRSTSDDDARDEVGMGGPHRNDTNRPAAGAGEFDDQSDDVPQTIEPVMHRAMPEGQPFAIPRRFPHPLLCGPRGVIRVMPDHPHEGECRLPEQTGAQIRIGGAELGPEYPPATDGGARPLPQVVSFSTVLPGTKSSYKEATEAQRFAGIVAYDGHRAGIGRVVTDATWHHFVNVNVTGDKQNYPESHPRWWGFLRTEAGQAHLEEIRAYWRNLPTWLCPPERLRCLRTRLAWGALFGDRVMEATLASPRIGLAETTPATLQLIGAHARDVIGRRAGQCQSLELTLDMLRPSMPGLAGLLDPWQPGASEFVGRGAGLPWFDLQPLLDIVLGAGMVALREVVPEPSPERARAFEPEKLAEILADGGRRGAEMALASLAEAQAGLAAMLARGG